MTTKSTRYELYCIKGYVGSFDTMDELDDYMQKRDKLGRSWITDPVEVVQVVVEHKPVKYKYVRP